MRIDGLIVAVATVPLLASAPALAATLNYSAYAQTVASINGGPFDTDTVNEENGANQAATSSSIQGTGLGDIELSASALASADLTTGKLRGTGTGQRRCTGDSVCNYSAGTFFTRLRDQIALSNGDVGAQEQWLVGFHFSADGTAVGTLQDGTIGVAGLNASVSSNDNTSAGFGWTFQGASSNGGPQGWDSIDWSADEDSLEATAWYRVTGNDALIDFNLQLDGGAFGSTTVAFSNTASMQILLPEGVTWETGAFGAVDTVPLPPALLLLGTALAGLLSMRSGRDKTAVEGSRP